MLVKYKYTYSGDGYVYHRGSANRTKSTKHSYGIVFAVCRGGFFGDELGCFDISMERIKRYLDGFEIVDEFLPQIPFSDVEIVRDDFSQDWQTKYVKFNPEARRYVEVTNYEPGVQEIKSFPEFFENGFWWRANDLNLEEADFAILQRYVEEYGAFYVRYMQQSGLVEEVR